MRWFERSVGLLALGGVLAALPLALTMMARPRELSVSVASPRPRALLASASAAPPAARVDPPGLLPRLRGPARPAGPGLALQTWEVSYGARWQREVSLPLWVGPFEQEGATGNCGFLLRVGAGLFEAGPGSPLAAEAEQAVRGVFPAHFELPGVAVDLPAAQKTELALAFGPGLLKVTLKVTLTDGTLINVNAPLALDTDQGKLKLQRRGAIGVSWSGPSRQALEQNPLVAGAAMLDRMFGGGDLIDRMAQAEVSKQADQILSRLSLGLDALSEPWAPSPGRPGDTVRLQVASPRVTAEGFQMHLCPAVTLAGPRLDESLRSFPRIPAPPPSLPPPSGPGDAIELAVDENGLNLLLYLLWQTSQLRRLGRSSQLLSALPQAAEQLAFSIEGFDPRLPPLVLPDRGAGRGLRVAVGDVRLGTWGRREVLGHGELRASLEGKGADLVLDARVERVWANCSEPVPGGIALTPCLSDLMPLLRDELGRHPTTLRLDGGWLLTALSSRSFSRFKVETGTPEVHTSPQSGGLRVRVGAKISRR